MANDRRQFLLATAALGVPVLGALAGDKKGDEKKATRKMSAPRKT